MKAKQSRQMAVLRWIALLLTAALMFTFAACGGGKEEDPSATQEPATADSATANTTTGSDIPAWSMEVRGVPTVSRFTSVDAQYLPKVEVTMTMQNQYGVNVTNKYGGVTLRSILNNFYVPDVVSVVVTSMSGGTVPYPQHLAMHQDTVLAWEIDGVPIDTPYPLRMCPGAGGGTEMFVENVSAIVVSPLTADMTTTVPTTYGQVLDMNGNPVPTLSPTYPTYNPNANTYTLPPVYTTVQPTDASGNPVTTTQPTTTTQRTTRTTAKLFTYIGPATAATTARTTTAKTTTTAGTTTTTQYDPFKPGSYDPPTAATTTTTTTTTTTESSDPPTN